MSYAATEIDATAITAGNVPWLAISEWRGASSTTETPAAPVGIFRLNVQRKASAFSSAAARVSAAAELAIYDLARYANFHRGWDGYDAEVFQSQTVQRAVDLVRALSDSFLRAQTEPSEITPGPIADGRIDVEAACDGRRLIVTVEAGSSDVEIFFDDRGSTHEELARWNADDLARWIRRLTGEDRMSAVVYYPARFARG